MPAGFQVAEILMGMLGKPVKLTDLAGTAFRFSNFLGQELIVQDPKTHQLKKLRFVKNDSGTTFFAGELVEFSVTAGEGGTHLQQLSSANGVLAYPIDDNYPSAGVPDQYGCFICVEGINLVITPATGIAAGAWAVMDRVVATSTGRAVVFDPNLGTTTQTNQIMHCLGRAMTAVTSGNTSTNRAIWIGHK